MHWSEVKVCENPSEFYIIFLTKFLCIYDAYLSKEKDRDIQSPWITAGIKKSSKHKQQLYETFMKTKNDKN